MSGTTVIIEGCVSSEVLMIFKVASILHCIPYGQNDVRCVAKGIIAWSRELIPQQPAGWSWRWLHVYSSGVLFAQQLAIAAMTGHRGRHANCHTQGKMSSTQFQPSCSLSSSSSSLQGHKNSSPWISCLHLLFRPRKGGDPISFSKTTSSWKHYHRGRQPSHLPLIQIHSRSRENRLKSSKLVNYEKKKKIWSCLYTPLLLWIDHVSFKFSKTSVQLEQSGMKMSSYALFQSNNEAAAQFNLRKKLALSTMF